MSRSMSCMDPPHWGQVQQAAAASAFVAPGVPCARAAASERKQIGNRAVRCRVARKPKCRMRTKPLGSRCNKKRRKNSSTGKVIKRFLFLCAYPSNGRRPFHPRRRPSDGSIWRPGAYSCRRVPRRRKDVSSKPPSRGEIIGGARRRRSCTLRVIATLEFLQHHFS